MSVIVTWDNDERTTVRYDFSGSWRWDEFRAAFRQAQEMMEGVGHMVDVIADFETSGCVPTETLARLAYVAARRPTNLGNSVVVGTKVFETTTLRVFGIFYGEMARAVHYAHSLDRARALLARSGLHYPLSDQTKSA